MFPGGAPVIAGPGRPCAGGGGAPVIAGQGRPALHDDDDDDCGRESRLYDDERSCASFPVAPSQGTRLAPSQGTRGDSFPSTSAATGLLTLWIQQAAVENSHGSS